MISIRPFSLLLRPGMLVALETRPAGAALFTGLELLADSLRAWERRAPLPDMASAPLIEELFPGAAIAQVGQALRDGRADSSAVENRAWLRRSADRRFGGV